MTELSEKNLQPEFVSPAQLSGAIGLASYTCKMKRLNGIWIEGIHWVKLNHSTVRYNLPLIRDWMANQGSPHIHQKAVDAYLASLLSSQARKKSRRSA